MKKTSVFWLLAIALGLATTFPALAQTSSVSGAGGILSAGTDVGTSNIDVSGVTLSNGAGTASFVCPITTFGRGTYQWNWSCDGGVLTINGAAVASLSGTMVYKCSGGGRDHPPTCWHIFSGTAVDSEGNMGAVSVSAKGPANNKPGTITAFSASW